MNYEGYMVNAILFVGSLYNQVDGPETFLNKEGKMLWRTKKDYVINYIKNSLGNDINKLGVSKKVEHIDDRSVVVLILLRNKESYNVEVGKVKVKGLRFPMVKQKNTWYFDLVKFLEGNY